MGLGCLPFSTSLLGRQRSRKDIVFLLCLRFVEGLLWTLSFRGCLWGVEGGKPQRLVYVATYAHTISLIPHLSSQAHKPLPFLLHTEHLQSSPPCCLPCTCSCILLLSQGCCGIRRRQSLWEEAGTNCHCLVGKGRGFCFRTDPDRWAPKV